MMSMSLAVLSLYGLALSLYLGFLVLPREGLGRGARYALLAAFLTHTVDIGLRCVQRIHPLATLDALGHRCIPLGFPLFTVAIVTGAIWVARLHMVSLRPEYSISIFTWVAFAGLLVARQAAGWQGRRAAWLTLAGFGGALV